MIFFFLWFEARRSEEMGLPAKVYGPEVIRALAVGPESLWSARQGKPMGPPPTRWVKMMVHGIETGNIKVNDRFSNKACLITRG